MQAELIVEGMHARDGERFIVKLQRSIFTTAGFPQLLTYDETREKVFTIGHCSDEMLARFGDRMKFYAAAHVAGNTLVIDDDVPDQPW